MTSNQFKVEIKYRLALLILYNLLKDEIITKENDHLYYHYYLIKHFLAYTLSFLTLVLRFLTSFRNDTKNGKESSVRTEIDEEKCKNRL